MLTSEHLSDSSALFPGRAEKQQPRGKELMVTSQELGHSPGEAGRRLLPFHHIAAFVHGVNQQVEALWGWLHSQEWEQHTPARQPQNRSMSPTDRALKFRVQIICCVVERDFR